MRGTNKMGWIAEEETGKKEVAAPPAPKQPTKSPFASIGKETSKRGLNVGIYGKGGTGKTEFIFSCPQPLFIIDTEMGSMPLHHQHPDVKVEINEIWEKSNDEIMERDDVKCFERIRESIDWLYQDPIEGGTIAIDSATDLWSMCQSYAKVKLFKIKPEDRMKFQFDWGKVNNLYKQILTKLLTMPLI